MRPPFLASLFLGTLLATLTATAPAQQPDTAPAAASEPSPTQKWLTQVSAQFQDAYDKTVLAPYKEGLETARKAYQTAIESALLSVSGAGQETEAAALRQERERFFSAGRMVPTEPSTSPLVQEARSKFRTQMVALEKVRAEKARPLHARFDAALAQNIPLLKQRQLLADAALLTAKREEIAREWLATDTAGSAAPKEEKAPALTYNSLKDSVEWLLENGVRIQYLNGKKTAMLRDVSQLPSGRVEFLGIGIQAAAQSTGAEKKAPEIRDRDLDRLAPLRGARNLSVLGFPFEDGAFTFLDAWKELEAFNISGARVTDKLAARLARFPMLRSLGVGRCGQITGDFVHQIAPALAKLEELRLTNTDVGDQCIDDLLALKRLSSLELRGTRITDQGLSKLASIKTLRDLDVGETKVTAAGLGALAGLKLASLGFLTTDSPSFATEAAQLAKVLPKLEGLTLNGSEFRPEHAEALLAFRELRTLSIKDAAPKPGALEALQKLKGLEEFRCASPGFGDDEVGALGEVKQLKRLVLNYTGITNNGLLKLAKNKDLKTVSALNTAVTEPGAAALEKGIRGLRVVH